LEQVLLQPKLQTRGKRNTGHCTGHHHFGAYRNSFERQSRTRQAAQYFDPHSAEITEDDSVWALATSRAVVYAVEQLLESNPPELFP
jgi:hypothetical protein